MTNLFFGRPVAAAHMSGNGISGTVLFFCRQGEIFLAADICGLPQNEQFGGYGVFGFHIHEGSSCGGIDFSDTGSHLNLDDRPHPYHTGDLPPLFSCNGKAFMVVRTGRFRISDIIGHTLVIHSQPDDFTTQPAGNSGTKIACGVICRT